MNTSNLMSKQAGIKKGGRQVVQQPSRNGQMRASSQLAKYAT